MSAGPDRDSAAFESLWRVHYPHVLAYARRRFEEHDARELAADTFLAAWRRRAACPADAPRAWLYGVARTLAAERRSAGSAALPGAVARLSERDREVLLLAAWEGLPPAEAARSFACSQVAYRLRLNLARRRLTRLPASGGPPADGPGPPPAALATANPVPEPAPGDADDERAEADRHRVWQSLRAERARRRGWRARRPLVLALALLGLAGAVAGVALVVPGLQDPNDTLPAWARIDVAGAEPLGRLGPFAYFEAPGGRAGARCLIQADAEDGLILASSCAGPRELSANGGMVGVRRAGGGYQLAGLLPRGITGARVGGRLLPVSDGVLLGTVTADPGVAIRVVGPGAPAAAAALDSLGRATYRRDGPDGPGYEVLTTPLGSP